MSGYRNDPSDHICPAAKEGLSKNKVHIKPQSINPSIKFLNEYFELSNQLVINQDLASGLVTGNILLFA